MKILVTGSEGFFASRFIQFYKDRYEIYSYSKNDMDITDLSAVQEIFSSVKPDIVVHGAAISDTLVCEKNPELSEKVNLRGSINIATGCSVVGAKLIFLSSDQVYKGLQHEGPYTEDIISPCNVYGLHKAQAEKEVAEINPNSVVLRLTWLFSLPERGERIKSNILYNVLKASIRDDKLSIIESDVRGVTYVYDLIEAMEGIFAATPGVYNAGSENSMKTHELVAYILSVFDLEHKLDSLLEITDKGNIDLHRDLRISTQKLQAQNISIPKASEGILRCVRDFGIK